VNDELERIGTDCCLILRYELSISLEGVKKIMKNVCQNSWSLGRDLNAGLPNQDLVQWWAFVVMIMNLWIVIPEGLCTNCDQSSI
jgi:hypothetical protein